jgi:hypothetical protein
MMHARRSFARLTSTHLEVRPRGWARLLAPYPRDLLIPVGEIESDTASTALEASRLLGWRLAGTGITRQRAMGWFTVRRERRSRAWVWLTPGRTVRVFRVRHGRLRVVVVPVDWFDN